MLGADAVAGRGVVGVAVGDAEDQHEPSLGGARVHGLVPACMRPSSSAPAGPQAVVPAGRPTGGGQGESSSRTLPLVSIPNSRVTTPPIRATAAKTAKT